MCQVSKETQLAKREAQVHAASMRIRGEKKLAEMEGKYASRLDRAKAQSEVIAGKMNDTGWISGIGEVGGMAVESAFRAKGMAKAQKFVGMGGVLVEIAGALMMNDSIERGSASESLVGMSVLGVGRGLRARLTLEAVDGTLDSLLK